MKRFIIRLIFDVTFLQHPLHVRVKKHVFRLIRKVPYVRQRIEKEINQVR